MRTRKTRPGTDSLRSVVLSQFEPDIAVSLIEFGKMLPRIDADIFVFMARKSLCLYDVFLALGLPPIEKPVTSDRILDFDLRPLRQKKIALIDDTLIVGTTLAKTKNSLETEVGAKVSAHVFCIDETWWCKNLISPDSTQLYLDDQRVMTFCTAEVRAFSLLPRPYLVDFPLTKPTQIRVGDFHFFLSSIEWISFRSSTPLQERNGIDVYSFLPTDEVLADFSDGLGQALASCIEISKVRAFVRRHEGHFIVRFVPIVTLKPLSTGSIAKFFGVILDRLKSSCQLTFSNIRDHVTTPKARHRFIQHALSAALGTRCFQSLQSSVGMQIDIGYDSAETDRHYGPWLHDEMDVVGKNAYRSLIRLGRVGGRHGPRINAQSLPRSITNWATDSLGDSRHPVPSLKQVKAKAFSGDLNLITTFTELFLRLYDTREIPARKEAKQLGRRILDAGPHEAPNRDRLDIGIPWNVLSAHVCKRAGLKPTRDLSNLFSLVLDVCNDQGVAVPITCFRDGVVFRAYRHGEDVRFSDGELALAYDSILGLQKQTKDPFVPRLVIEKLLALLLKIGVASGFLEPLYGQSGVEGVARIGFNLKGAVPKFVRGPRDRADRETWLSSYLVQRGVLVVGKNGKYTLGSRVDGNYLTDNAPDQAYELGCILGMLLRSAAHSSRSTAPLDSKSLIIIATCWPPRHAAGALQVELDIFRHWFEGNVVQFSKIDWKNWKSLNESLRILTNRKGYEALTSAAMKYVAYRTREDRKVIEACATFLDRTQSNELPARKWRSYWRALQSVDAGETERFDPLIDRCAALAWEAGLALMTLEVAILAARVHILGPKMRHDLRAAFKRIRQFSEEMALTGLPAASVVQKLTQRLLELEASHPSKFNHKDAGTYAVTHLSEMIPAMSTTVDALEPILSEYGRISGRESYAYMLYYDVFDSTATVTGRSGKDVEHYRGESVRPYKALLSSGFHRLGNLARKQDTEIFCWNGTKSSSNDCKHAFFRGKAALAYLVEVVRLLLESTQSFRGIRVRIHAVPCNFAGGGAYRFKTDTEIHGERFWEHWSRIGKKASELEKQCGNGQSFLLIATNELVESLTLPENISWVAQHDDDVTSEIELLTRTTRVRYGAIAVK